MNNDINKRNRKSDRLKIILTMLILDIVVCGYWIYVLKPDQGLGFVMIGLLSLIISLASIIIACVAYYKKKYYAPLFLINAAASCLIMFLECKIYFAVTSVGF